MLMESRYGEYFRVEGDFTTHFGIFDCNCTGDNHKENSPSGLCC